jgi:hypothetical protein
MKILYTFCWILILFIASCRVIYTPTQSKALQISVQQRTVDSVSTGNYSSVALMKDAAKIDSFLSPYKTALDSIMDEEIGEATSEFTKRRPAGSLGNLVADAILWKMSRWLTTRPEKSYMSQLWAITN